MKPAHLVKTAAGAVSSIEAVLSRFEGVTRSSTGWAACCPAHKDKSPSLSIAESDDGRVLLHCFSGCDTGSVLNAAGLTFSDLFPEGLSAPARMDYRIRSLRAAKQKAELLDGIAKANMASLSDDEVLLAVKAANDIDRIDQELKSLEQERVNAETAPKVFPKFPHLSIKSRPLNTIQNMRTLLNAYGARARYNLIAKSVELDLPGLVATGDNRANVALATLASYAAEHSMPRESLVEYVKAIADSQAYSPVADWIRSAPWDGQDRLAAFFATVEADDESFKNALLKRWMISAVAAAVMPTGFWSKGVLTFAGPQNLGKTSWFRALVPDAMRTMIREGMHLDAQNRDHVMTAVSNWLVELGELEATLRRDMESLKAFITQTADRLRRPYDRVDSEYPRRTVFFASVNSERFLKDATGNSRFWVVRCKRINYNHGLNMQQVWAQVHAQYFSQGEQWHLTEAEQQQLEHSNSEFREVSPIEELIPSKYDLQLEPKQFITATQMLLNLGYDRPTRPQQLDATQALRSLGIPSKRVGGRTLWGLPLEKFGY